MSMDPSQLVQRMLRNRIHNNSMHGDSKKSPFH